MTSKRKKTVKKSARSKGRRSTTKRVYTEAGQKVQTANQVTWLLKGSLKNVQLSYLRVGRLLARVRDEKMFLSLKHPDIETYAHERLNLGRSSLFNYLRIYDWTLKCHPEWLENKVKGEIPDLSNAGDLLWVESELSRTDLKESDRSKLAELQQKVLDGKFIRNDLKILRKKASTVKDSLKALISEVRTVRKHAKAMVNCPPEALLHLDSTIEILSNERSLKVAMLDTVDASHTFWYQNKYA